MPKYSSNLLIGNLASFNVNKIIFFVKPEHQSTDRKKLQKEAEAVAALKQKPPKLKLTKHQIIKTAVLSLLFTMAGCGITFIITLLV